MSNNEITVLPINLLQSFIDSNDTALKMLHDLIDNTLERQYILISDSLSILDNSRRNARQNNPQTYNRFEPRYNHLRHYSYGRNNRSSVRNRPLRRSQMNNIFNPTPPLPYPPSRPPPPPPPPLPSQNNISTQTNFNNILRQFANPFRDARENGFTFNFGSPSGSNTFYDNVPITPSETQINNATISDIFENIENTSDQLRCPIDQQDFDPTDNVLKIRHCGHIFKSHNLRNWFNHSSRCPVCRYDIRDCSGNNISNNDVSNNNISNNDVSNNDVSNNIIDINDINLEVILEQTVRNISSSGPVLNSMINLANNLANQIIENTDISGAFMSNNTI